MKTAVSTPNLPTTQSWSQLINSRWLALADLGLVAAAGGLWYLTRGEIGGWPLLLALLPWVARLAAGQFPWRRTRLDWLLGLFLLTAVSSFWTAYNPTAASGKWWLIVGAVLLYVALASQPADNWWLIVTGLGGTAVLIAIYFLLTHDWQAIPAKVERLNNWGLAWMQMRPALTVHQMHPNVAGGLMALLTPFLLAALGRNWQQKQWGGVALGASGLALLSLGLLLTTSRGAWLALVVALVVWGIWAVSQQFHALLHLSPRQAFLIGLFMLTCLGFSLLMLNPAGAASLLNSLPGPAQAGNRFNIAQQTWDLIGDYPFIGAGLGTFPALYGQYIQVVPHHLIIHSHNLFLDVALEQGLVGLVIFVGLVGTAVFYLTGVSSEHSTNRRPPTTVHYSLFTGSLLASTTVLVLHGLVEDPLYGSRGLLLLFLNAGLAMAITKPQPSRFWQQLKGDWVGQWVAGTLLLVVVIILFAYRYPIQASWQANLGAIQLAQLELADWPTGEWQTADFAPAYQPAKTQLERAFATYPFNRTANYHLGRLALLEQDFETAVSYLERAHNLDPTHRGIRKTLGYSYLWSGQPSQAAQLLSGLPEIPGELATYPWWWTTQERDDLAQLAQQISQP